MDNFLEKDYRMRLTILDYLKKNPSNLSALGKELNLNYKTLREALIQIDQDIKNSGLAEYIKIGKDMKGFLSCNTGVFALDRLADYYLKKSVCFQAVEALFQGKYENLDRFAQGQFVSNTTAARRLVEIRGVMENYGLKFKISTGEIVGTEVQKRFFFYNFYWNMPGFEHILSESEHWNEIRDCIDKIGDNTGFLVSYRSKRKAKLLIALILKRMNQRYYINLPNWKALFTLLNEESENFRIFYSYILMCFEKLGIKFSMKLQKEVTFLYEFMFTEEADLVLSDVPLFMRLYPEVLHDSMTFAEYLLEDLGNGETQERAEEIKRAYFISFLRSKGAYRMYHEMIPFYKHDLTVAPFYINYEYIKMKMETNYYRKLPGYIKRDLNQQIKQTALLFQANQLVVLKPLKIAVLVTYQRYVADFVKTKLLEAFPWGIVLENELTDHSDIIISDIIDPSWDKSIQIFSPIVGNDQWYELLGYIGDKLKERIPKFCT